MPHEFGELCPISVLMSHFGLKPEVVGKFWSAHIVWSFSLRTRENLPENEVLSLSRINYDANKIYRNKL